MSQWQTEKETVLETSRKMLERGLVVGTSGNVSLRLPGDGDRQLLAITPSSMYYDLMHVDDIQVVDFQGETVEGNLKPSTETMLHIGIYKTRPDINAIVHTHSVSASAVSVTGRDIPPILVDQAVFLGGEIKLARHYTTGNREQVPDVLAALEDRNAVLLTNHGAMGTGSTMREAFIACELIEKTAATYLQALAAGKVNRLPDESLKLARQLYTKSRNASING
jgi:L-fuculose-phosphate aldolase